MIESKMFTVILLSFLCLSLEISAYKIRSISKQRQFPGLQFVNAGTYLKDDSFAYVTCDEPFEGAVKKCVIKLESNTIDDITYADTCEIYLKSKLKNGVVERYIKVFEFLKNKYIIIWQDKCQNSDASCLGSTGETFLKLTMVDFPSCKKSEQKIFEGDYGEIVSIFSVIDVIRQNSSVFNVVFPNESLCQGRLCKMSFDVNGRKINDPDSWILSDPKTRQVFYPIHNESASSDNYLLLSTFSNYYTVSTVDSNNTLRELKKHIRTTKENAAVSTSNEALGVCFIVDLTVQCSQYNLQGEQKLDVAVKFSYASPYSAIYNLANGGFLMMTTMCSLKDPCLYDGNHFYVTKVDDKGQRYRSLEIQGFDCNFNTQRLLMGFYQNKSDEYCLSLICAKMKDGEREHYNLTTTCFEESAVSVPF